MSPVLQLDSVAKSIGDLVLFDEVSLLLNRSEKAALVGPNGAGKTTMLNLIARLDSPNAGTVKIAKNTRFAYLTQDPVLPENETVINTLFRTENKLIEVIKNYESALQSENIREIEKCSNEMDRMELWDFENRIKKMLTQLEILNFKQKIEELSGGQKKRIALANALLNEPDLLILDEPTNHLDLKVIEWLENYLLRSNLTLLMVTHDRFFLDRICGGIFEIDQKKLYRYSGNYSRFVEQRTRRIELEKEEVEKAKNLLRKEEDWMQRMPKARGTKAKYRIDRYYALKGISNKTRDEKKINLNIRETRLGSKIMVAKNIDFTWDGEYYLKDFSYTFSRFDKIGIIGSNGSGKSTFLEIMMKNLQPGSGSIETGETIRFGYYRQAGIDFDENMKVLDAVTEIAETVQVANGERITSSQFLNYFLFPPQRQHDYISKLSGGEKRRLYLCQVLMQNPNFLILDEPTNDLDIISLQVLEEYLASFNGCVLVVSHDRYFMDSVVDHLFVFEGEGNIKDFPGNYSEYFEWKKSHEKEVEKVAEPQPKEKPKKIRDNLKLTYKEKRELEQLEKDINKLEIEKSELEEELNSGILSAKELTEKSQRIGRVLEILEEKSDRWLELSEKV